MKDRLREAIFNLLGPGVRGAHALDLFAGTGALALEALSRGADRATLIEQHYPTAEVIRQNVAALAVEDQTEIVVGNVFVWWKRLLATRQPISPLPTNLWSVPGEGTWLVFCSPPYDFYVERSDEMLELIAGLIETAPRGSAFVVEADARFDFGRLPESQAWDVRRYPPAVVGIFWKA
jgi:16S rRNA (guanine966-N2)-methyltransferase